MSTTLLAVSHPVPVNYLTRIVSTLTTIYTFVVTENPLLWKRRQGRNEDADGRGPYFVHGAPLRQIEPGKGVLASLGFLKSRQHGAYLFTGRIIDHKGDPVAGATIDFWHACPGGDYYFDRYELRGKVITDSNGCFEVLSVTPGGYLGRAGHFHYIITPPGPDQSKYKALTTQSYVCKSNNKNKMNTDFVNWFYMRNPPYNRVITSWSIPDSNNGKQICGFPPLSDITTDEVERERVNLQIKQWNKRLASLEEFKGEGVLKIAAGGHAETRLSPPGSW